MDSVEKVGNVDVAVPLVYTVGTVEEETMEEFGPAPEKAGNLGSSKIEEVVGGA